MPYGENVPARARETQLLPVAARIFWGTSRAGTEDALAAGNRLWHSRPMSTKNDRQERASRTLAALQARYPAPHTHLDARNAWELLVATVLAAQCTDARVNTVTPELFRRWPDAAALAEAIQNAHTRLHRCRVCQNYTEAELCPICSSAKRDRSTICVVETPRDVQAFERTREYHGLYHVLHGLISPMDGIGAEQLSVKELLARLGSGEVKEVIMAMNPTVEGEATAMYLAKLIKPLGIKTTRLAYGLPVGGSLEYTDETTLYRALSGRDEL